MHRIIDNRKGQGDQRRTSTRGGMLSWRTSRAKNTPETVSPGTSHEALGNHVAQSTMSVACSSVQSGCAYHDDNQSAEACTNDAQGQMRYLRQRSTRMYGGDLASAVAAIVSKTYI